LELESARSALTKSIPLSTQLEPALGVRRLEELSAVAGEIDFDHLTDDVAVVKDENRRHLTRECRMPVPPGAKACTGIVSSGSGARW
jgi:hypothetical protein